MKKKLLLCLAFSLFLLYSCREDEKFSVNDSGATVTNALLDAIKQEYEVEFGLMTELRKDLLQRPLWSKIQKRTEGRFTYYAVPFDTYKDSLTTYLLVKFDGDSSYYSIKVRKNNTPLLFRREGYLYSKKEGYKLVEGGMHEGNFAVYKSSDLSAKARVSAYVKSPKTLGVNDDNLLDEVTIIGKKPETTINYINDNPVDDYQTTKPYTGNPFAGTSSDPGGGLSENDKKLQEIEKKITSQLFDLSNLSADQKTLLNQEIKDLSEIKGFDVLIKKLVDTLGSVRIKILFKDNGMLPGTGEYDPKNDCFYAASSDFSSFMTDAFPEELIHLIQAKCIYEGGIFQYTVNNRNNLEYESKILIDILNCIHDPYSNFYTSISFNLEEQDSFATFMRTLTKDGKFPDYINNSYFNYEYKYFLQKYNIYHNNDGTGTITFLPLLIMYVFDNF